MSDDFEPMTWADFIGKIRKDCALPLNGKLLERYRAVLPRVAPMPDDIRPPTGYYREPLPPAPPKRRMMACRVSVREAAELCGRLIINDVPEVCLLPRQEWHRFDESPWILFEDVGLLPIGEAYPAAALDRVLTWQIGRFARDVNAKLYTFERWWHGFDVESGDLVVMIRATKEAS